MQTLTWTCHICKQERPDECISVMKHQTTINGVPITQNVRYCNDRIDCADQAVDFRFIPDNK